MHVRLSRKNYRRLNLYAKATGQSIDTVVNDVLSEWWTCTGDVIMGELKKPKKVGKQGMPLPKCRVLVFRLPLATLPPHGPTNSQAMQSQPGQPQ